MGRRGIHGVVAAIAILFTVLCPSTAPAAAILIGSDTSNDVMLSINTATGQGTPLFSLQGLTVADLAYDRNHDVLYATTTAQNSLYRVNLATGVFTLVAHYAVGVTLMHGLEYDSTHDVLYGITNQTSTRALYKVNVNNAALTLVGVHNIEGLNDLAYDPVNQVMYAAESHDPTHVQALRTINLQTGATTLVGNFNGAGGIQIGVGLAYDPLLGMYAVDNKAGGSVSDDVWKVNPATGQATRIGPIGATSGQNVIGLTFIPEPASAAMLLCGAAAALAARRARIARAGEGRSPRSANASSARSAGARP